MTHQPGHPPGHLVTLVHQLPLARAARHILALLLVNLELENPVFKILISLWLSSDLSRTGVTRGLVHCAALPARLLVRDLVTFLLRNLVAASSLAVASLIRSRSSPFPHEVVSSLGEVQRITLHLIIRVLYIQAPVDPILISSTSTSSIIDWLKASTNSASA